MDKLKSLQPTSWKSIEAQAELIFNTIKRFQEDGKKEVKMEGVLQVVNKAILKTNGFIVMDKCVDFATGKACYTIAWD